MSKLDDIKKGNERRKEIAISRSTKFNLLDEVEFKILVDLSIEDIDYLLHRLERCENALKNILDHGDDRPDCYPLYNIAEEALKEG